MINLVSHKYKYILRTFPKSGCSTLRNLFFNIHWKELGYKQKPLNEDNHLGNKHRSPVYWDDDIFKQYKHYHKIYIIRNSYERVVSMYFNICLLIPDLNSLLPEFDCMKSQMEYYINRGVDAQTFNDFLDGLLLKSNKGIPFMNKHYEPQKIVGRDDNSSVIYLNEMNTTLPQVYRDVIKFPDEYVSIVKMLLNDKKEVLKKRDLGDYGKLNNYNFQEDKYKLNIIKNGVPHKNQMITKKGAMKIKKIYSDEIDIHDFDYNHLL